MKVRIHSAAFEDVGSSSNPILDAIFLPSSEDDTPKRPKNEVPDVRQRSPKSLMFEWPEKVPFFGVSW